MLAWTIYISFIGAAAQLVLPRDKDQWARWLGLSTAVLGLGCGLLSAWGFHPAGQVQTIVHHAWIRTLGIDYFLAVDGISLILVLLTGIAAVAGVLFSWNVKRQVPQFFALYFTLIGGVYGVFLSFDWFLLFVFYELAIVPKYFLIAIWGSKNARYAGMKLALYSFVGSALVLIAMVAAYVAAGARTMDITVLAQFPFPKTLQVWMLPLVFIGFGVLAGLWPMHTWAPTGHAAAPTAASMLLAGVVMKLGAYGALRVGLTLFPLGLKVWQPVLAWLAVIGIVYGAMVALTQQDFKFVIGYSSVSHMGFVLLGLVSMSVVGLSGAVLQMFSHGIIAGLLFAVVGRMVYDRTHTRELSALEGMQLSKAIPFAAVTFVVASMASMGLPGFSGFVAELSVIAGTWHAFPVLAIVAGAGVLVGIGYTLRVLQRAFFAEETVSVNASPPTLEPITLPEKLGASLLILSTLAVGLFPGPFLDLIMSGFQTPLFDGLRKGGLL